MPSSASATLVSYTLSLHDALPISKLFVEFITSREGQALIKEFGRIPAHPELPLGWSVNPKQLKLHGVGVISPERASQVIRDWRHVRSEEHTSELQSHHDLVCRLLLPPPS